MDEVLHNVTLSPYFEWREYMVFQDADGNPHVITEMESAIDSCDLADHPANVGPLLEMLRKACDTHVQVWTYRQGVYKATSPGHDDKWSYGPDSLVCCLARAIVQLGGLPGVGDLHSTRCDHMKVATELVGKAVANTYPEGVSDYNILMELAAEYKSRSLEMGKAASEFEAEGHHKDAEDCREVAEHFANKRDALYNAATISGITQITQKDKEPTEEKYEVSPTTQAEKPAGSE